MEGKIDRLDNSQADHSSPKDSEKFLEQVKAFADQAHGEQMRKYAPERYIAHPIRVMNRCAQYTSDRNVLAAALLHDVLEDTQVKKEEILNFFHELTSKENAERILHLVEELTDIFTKENYPNWNRYKRKQKEAARLEKVSGEAQTIKYADVIDNSVEIVEQDPDFAKRYLSEARKLLAALKKGDPVLRQQAIEMITESISRLEKFSQ
jgi:(p)ppGpp synthase/HD superfamily hydrolase